MIAILTIPFEWSTNHVIDWIIKLQGTFQRVNNPIFSKKETFSLCLDNHTTEKLCLNNNITTEKIHVIWYRRTATEVPNTLHLTDEKLEKDIRTYLHQELNILKESIYQILKKKKWLSHPSTARANKIHVLTIANQVGLEIPATLITTSKKELTTFVELYPKIISKPIGELAVFEYDKKHYWKYTTAPDRKQIEQYDDFIFPTLVQALIEKEYEVRTFYLEGTFYSMAIFSQLDDQTATDFRKYNFEKPNRKTVYQLPQEVEEKLTQLMQALNLNTGSIDIIKAKDGRYVFLEVNPVGQYGMISNPCNYYLDREIAEWLIKNDNANSSN